MISESIEWSQQKLSKSFSTKEIFYLCGFFVLALTIRAVNMRWGLPGQFYYYSAYVADEAGILNASMSIGRGSYLMHMLQNYPFFYYLSFLVLSSYYGLGLLVGSFADLSDFHAEYVANPEQFLLVGRYFILFSSSVTVVITYLLARHLFTKRTAFFASLFLTFSLGHVMYSQIFRLDSFLPLLFVLTFWFIVRAKESSQLRPYVICSILLAFTMATKITAWAMLVPFLLLPFLTNTKFGISWPKIDRRFIFAVYVSFILYIVQIVLVLPEMLDILSGIATRLDKSGSFGNPADLSPYRYSIFWYLTRVFPQQMSWPTYLLAIGGLGLLLKDRSKRQYVWLFYALFFAYLIPVGYATRTTWRDMLPLLPFLSIVAGYSFDWLVQKVIMRQPMLVQRVTSSGFIAIVLFLVLIWPITDVVQNKYLLLQEDTREIATAWIEQSIPAGTNIAMEAYGPAILGVKQQEDIQRRLTALNRQIPQATQPSYYVFELHWELVESASLLLPDKLPLYLIENEIEYVVVSSGYYARFYNDAVDIHFPEHGLRGREFHDLIASNLQLVQVFVPNWYNRPGPVIQIFQVPSNLDENFILIPDSFDPYHGLVPPASAVGYYQTAPH